MKPTKSNDIVLTLVLLTGLSTLPFCCCTNAQSYAVDWSSIDGGGGTSTGGVYEVSGTIGQPDAGTMSGGNFTLEGGFWSAITAIQTPGAPLLSIRRADGNSVLLCWPYPSEGFGLQQCTNLNTVNWMAVTNARVQVGDEWQVTVTPSLEIVVDPQTGQIMNNCLYFRLKKP